MWELMDSFAGAGGMGPAWRGWCVPKRCFEPKTAETETDLRVFGASLIHLLEANEDEQLCSVFFCPVVSNLGRYSSIIFTTARGIMLKFIGQSVFATMTESATLAVSTDLKQSVLCAALQSKMTSKMLRRSCNQGVESKEIAKAESFESFREMS